jgi:transposase-like protein
MKAYSEDLRKKIVEALRRGTSKSEAARLFGVSLSSVKRYAKMVNEGRTLAPKETPASDRRSTSAAGGSWRPISMLVPPPRYPKDASSSRRWLG